VRSEPSSMVEVGVVKFMEGDSDGERIECSQCIKHRSSILVIPCTTNDLP